MDPDELYTLRNLFWLGLYQQAINEGNSLSRITQALNTEKTELIMRSYVALGQHDMVQAEVTDDSAISLKAIKALSTYMTGQREAALSQVIAWCAESTDPTLEVVASVMHTHEGNLKEAMKAISKGQTMEQNLAMVSLLLRMDRPDLAQKKQKEMRAVDEDNPLTQLACAWIYMRAGESKVQEACNIYEDLIDKFGGSPLLLNGAASTKMHMGEYEEAESLLLEALTKISGDSDSLANLVVVSQQLRRPEEVINRYLSQLKTSSPDHMLLKSLAVFEGAFDRMAATLSV
jgi:coatomer subunit epsilon